MRRLLGAILAAVLLLEGCGKEPVQTTGLFPDTATAETTQASTEAEQIASDLSITDLKRLRGRNIKGLFFNGSQIYTDAAVLVSENDKADLVGVFYVTDLQQAEEGIRSYLAQMKSQYNVYSSSERFKIDNAAMADNSKDKIVVIICDDVEAAEKKAEEAVQQ